MAITLNNNAIYSVFQNMIISQQTFANPIGGLKSDIVDKNRVDGTLYGDQKSYKSVDMIHSVAWTNDSEATNLLALKRNKNVKDETITLDQFRMFKLTLDSFLTKQAFMNEGNFANFNSVQLSMIRDGLKAFDVSTYNTYIGTHGTQTRTITVGAGANEALVLANGVADILDDMAELSRDYNYNQFLRAFGKEDYSIIFNNRYLNGWKYQDLPIVFHKDGILADHDVMNERYFGIPITEANYSTYSAATPTAGKPIDSDDGTYVPGTNHANGTLRVLEECSVTVGGTTYELFAGEEVPSGAVVYDSTAAAGSKVKVPCYIQDNTIVGIILGNLAVPYMSAAENSTAFYNPQSLTTTNFLIFGRNTLKALGEKPYVVIRKATS